MRNEPLKPIPTCDGKSLACSTNTDCELCSTNKNEVACNPSGYCQLNGTDTDCDAKAGFFKVLQGDVILGRWNARCRSLDPGIATETQGNLMCAGAAGALPVDYTSNLPQTSDCDHCKNSKETLVKVAGNRFMREYVMCTQRY